MILERSELVSGSIPQGGLSDDEICEAMRREDLNEGHYDHRNAAELLPRRSQLRID